MKMNKKTFSGLFSRSLDYIEIVGNRLPHPATLFLMLAVIVALVSWIGAALDLRAAHPVDGTPIAVRNLLDWDGVRWIYQNVVRNFVEFPPLGTGAGGRWSASAWRKGRASSR
jgi:aminobenzoyl-glutamate transport protein